MNNYSAILCLTNLGDGVLLSPCISALAENMPETKWVLVAKPSVCELYACDNRISEFIPFTCSWFPGTNGYCDGWKGFRNAAKSLRKLQCKTALNTCSDTRTNLLARLGGVKQLISASGRHGDWLSTEIVASDLTFQHEAERQLELASALAGRKLGPYPLKIELSDADRQNASLLLNSVVQNKGTLIAMHPGANADFKAWPLDRFIEIGRYLTQEKKARIAVLGTNGQETEMANKLSSAVGPMAVNLAGKTPVRTLAAFLKLCDMYIGNDSGPMHLAAAAGCPTVAIFGATNPDRFGPYLPEDFKRVVVSKDFNHSLVGKAGEIGKKILKTISVEMVTEAVDDLWNIVVDRFKSRSGEKNDL